MRGSVLASLALAGLSALALGGCSTTSHVLISPPRAAIPVSQVRLYFQPPPGRYVEIALLETASGAFTYGDQAKTNAVLMKLRAEAASLGANGVLFQGTAQAPGGNRVGVGVGGGSFGHHTHLGGGVGVDISPNQKHARGIAILVEDPPPPPPPPAPAPQG